MVAKLNGGYLTQDEVREYLSRIWGQPVDPSVRMFPPFYTVLYHSIPFYTNMGKRTRMFMGWR